MRQTSRLIALAFPGYPDPGVAIAASRAGALGVLDLEYCTEQATARAAVEALERFGKGGLGVKVAVDNRVVGASFLAALPAAIQHIILTRPDPRTLGMLVRKLTRQGRRVLVEATDLAGAQLAHEAGAAGVILKGNEAGGRVGEETAFVLFQRCVAQVGLPLWVQGGIGLHTAAAGIAGGAAGVVVDWQLALTRESRLPQALKTFIATMDGSETAILGGDWPGEAYRVYDRPGLAAVEVLRGLERDLLGQPALDTSAWTGALAERIGGADGLYLVGQDAAFAAGLAERYVTVGGVLDALAASIPEHIDAARTAQPLAEQAPLARSHGTRYPVLQGPMTRVSDVAPFCEAVAAGGGLPFLALALLRAPQVETLLQETQARLGNRPWGVGILGFVPLELRQEQLEVVRRYRPPFAIIAGGRPDQAAKLEADGITTYLHVPSPGLLELFLGNGARRFIFEGRECGGHVGPRSSFVLWESMVQKLLAQIEAGKVRATDCHVVFAGGVHDARSAAMVATLAGTLAARGAKIGVLMGTAYLFTEEAVSSGAIVEQFQQEALVCDHTVLLETGPGHAIRCADTPFRTTFAERKQELMASDQPKEAVRLALEDLNLGRLRIASKGITRNERFGAEADAPRYVAVDSEEQRREGMYMIGQVASLRHGRTTIAALHHEVAADGTAFLATLAETTPETQPAAKPSDIAIVGMSTLLPKAPTLSQYWENILNKVDAITEVPRDRWDPDDYFSADRAERDRLYSRWGGFLDPVPFDPLTYGMPPNTLPSIEPLQLLTLEATRAALADAGYSNRPFDREHTSVILGAGGGAGDLGQLYSFRTTLPTFLGKQADAAVAALGTALPEWTEDSFAGVLINVAAGRVANRFNLGGSNFTVDAACASSLAAVYLAVRELETGASNMAIVGGIDTMQSAFAFMCFAKTQALSPRGRCRTFDDTSDGIAISEGLAMVVLKRLDDAERDGDRIYAVIKGAGSSSDGRDKGLTAPRPEGQVRALERAYAKAGVSPATIGLVEAHGTGTAAGDKAEVTSLTQFFSRVQAPLQSCAIGSVKSMIGHTKCAAGVASVVKVALALHHKVLPPTLGVETPNSKANFPQTPFYVNSETRPWIARPDGNPRRAGVSAFGFGGTNFHVVLEEYTGAYAPESAATLERWPSELFLWKADDRAAALQQLTAIEHALSAGAEPRLADLAYTVCAAAQQRGGPEGAPVCLAVVADSLDDLRQKLATARSLLADPDRKAIADANGLYYSEQPLAREGKLAFVFPGQGSQYPNMGRDLTLIFAEARSAYEEADGVLAGLFERPLSSYLFPPPSFTPQEEQARRDAITDTHVAQPALAATSVATMRVLATLGVTPDATAGHSFAEFVALHAAGVIDATTLFHIAEARGRFLKEGAGPDAGVMAAVAADVATVVAVIAGMEGVWAANLNAPKQVVISGERAAIERAVAAFGERRIRARLLPVACAFHSPLVAHARGQLAAVLADAAFQSPRLPVYANSTGEIHSDRPDEIVALMSDHLVRPVEFIHEIEQMYADGVRLFVEIGPKSVMTNLVGHILGDRPHAAIATDQDGRSGLRQLQLALARLAAEGVAVQPARLFAGRGVRALNLAALQQERAGAILSPTTWLVTGARAVPVRDAAKPVARPRLSLRGTKADDSAASHGAIEQTEVEPAAMTHATPSPATAPPLNGVAHRNGHAAVHPVAPAPVTVPAVVPSQAVPAPRPTVEQSAMAPAPTGAVSAYRPDAAAVMGQFQQVMGRFLDTQRAVMLAYLTGNAGAAPANADLSLGMPTTAPALGGQTAPARGYPVATPALPAPMPVVAAPAQPAVQVAPAPVPTVSLVESPRAPAAVVAAPEPEPVAPAPTLAAPPASPAITKESLTNQLLAIVTERTGYPSDMLGLDLDLEADLGIDSIKRVEILGTLQQQLGTQSERAEAAMEQLAAIKTLRGIIDWMAANSGAAGDSSPAAPAAIVDGSATAPAGTGATGAADVEPADDHGILRSTVTVVEAPLAPALPGAAPAGTVVITDDERGIAVALAARLRERGLTVALVRAEGAAKQTAEALSCSFTSSAAIAALASEVRRQHGPVAGLVHLLPARAAPALSQLDLAGWQTRLAEDIEGFYHLARAFGADLHAAGKEAGHNAVVLGVTAMGGAFGSTGAPGGFAGNGGVAGLAKTLAQEWRDVRVRAVDLAEGEPEALAAQLEAELFTADSETEVGYLANKRVTLRPRPVSLVAKEPALAIDPSWVILLTGGARGITADVALELARRYRPTLLLVGRSPLPAGTEDPSTARWETPKDLKAAIIDQMRARGEKPAPAAVEKEYRHLMQEREMRRTMREIEATGAMARYIALDVRDEAAVRAFLDSVYEHYHRLDGVIHGAGIIEDKLIEQKDEASFERVFATKADSAYLLTRYLRFDRLRFLTFFSSASARFGNRGQVDYAAANEVLNKLAIELNRAHATRVVAVNWGPWASGGMVSPELERQFAERGVLLIPRDVGARLLDSELRYGSKDAAEVLLAGGAWASAPKPVGAAAP